MLSVKQLSKTFGTKKVIDDVSFSVPQGRIAVFLGPSGVGKSTLLRVLNNLEAPSAGTITLNDKPLDLSKVTSNHICGMVFQQFNLFNHLTALENITLALEKVLKMPKAQAQKKAVALLEQYGLADKKDVYPEHLSGGQKQRLALARTIALEPTIICFDEPTSALDPLLTTHVARIIQKLADDGYIVLIATHDTALLDKLKATVYLMDNGKIIEQADTKELQKNPSSFQRIAQFVAGKVDE